MRKSHVVRKSLKQGRKSKLQSRLEKKSESQDSIIDKSISKESSFLNEGGSMISKSLRPDSAGRSSLIGSRDNSVLLNPSPERPPNEVPEKPPGEVEL